MKRILIILTSFVFCSFNVGLAQYTQLTNVKTPNSSTVLDTYSFTGIDISYTTSQLVALATQIAANYNGAELIDAPSFKYNCHAYAWHVVEGGSKVWIGYSSTTAHSAYWTDGSYVEVPESSATKVVYVGNHSAIRLNSTWYQSKWGSDALVKHHPNDVPSIYQPSLTKKYYAIAPINSPPTLCYGSSFTFTANNPQAGFTWDKSAGINLSSTTANPVQATVTNSSVAAQGWVSIKNSGGVEVARRNVWLGKPVLYGISGPDVVGSQETYCVSYPAYLNPSLYWQITMGDGYIFNDWQQCVLVNFYGQETYNLKVTATNACGSCYDQKIVYSSGRGFSTFPNPVDDILTVEIEEQARQQAADYDIRLYDINGVLRRQTTTKGSSVQFNVSNLPNGIYSLHIYDGTNNKPEMRTIVVHH